MPAQMLNFEIGFDCLIQNYKINDIHFNQNLGNPMHVIIMPSRVAFVNKSFHRCMLTQKRTVYVLIVTVVSFFKIHPYDINFTFKRKIHSNLKT